MTDSNLIPQDENTVPEGAFGIGSKETDDFTENERLKNFGIKDIPKAIFDQLKSNSGAIVVPNQITEEVIEKAAENQDKFLKPRSLWIAGVKKLNSSEIFLHTFIAFLLILIGWMDHRASISNFVEVLPYIFAFMGCLLTFQINLDFDETKCEWYNFDWDQKEQTFSISTLLL